MINPIILTLLIYQYSFESYFYYLALPKASIISDSFKSYLQKDFTFFLRNYTNSDHILMKFMAIAILTFSYLVFLNIFIINKYVYHLILLLTVKWN